MTMEIQAKLYPNTIAEVGKSKEALERFKGVLAEMGVSVQHKLTLPVTEGIEVRKSTYQGPDGPQEQNYSLLVVSIAGHIHFDDERAMRAVDVEMLSMALHEAGREAVEKGLVVNKVPGPFMGWEEITEAAREGRRVQARYLLANYSIKPGGTT